jgi:membrane-bound lytic murein transglycosylase B
MNPGLLKTLVASFAVAGLLNIIQITSDYNAHAKAAFSGSSVPAAAAAVSANAAAKPADTPAQAIAAATPDSTASSAEADPVAAIAAKLSAGGLKPDFAASYLGAEQQTGTPWQLLAAVHQVETGQSGNTARSSYAGAVGPMQFMPATFRAYSLDGDANGTKDITDLDDAMLSAGNYLRAGGADKGRYAAALYNYNHSNAYVNQVMGIAHRLGL